MIFFHVLVWIRVSYFSETVLIWLLEFVLD